MANLAIGWGTKYNHTCTFIFINEHELNVHVVFIMQLWVEWKEGATCLCYSCAILLFNDSIVIGWLYINYNDSFWEHDYCWRQSFFKIMVYACLNLSTLHYDIYIAWLIRVQQTYVAACVRTWYTLQALSLQVQFCQQSAVIYKSVS